MYKYRILIVKLTSLGDVIHTYPMVYDIKLNVSNCLIDWLVDESFADLVRLNPHINQVISIPLRRWLSASSLSKLLLKPITIIGKLYGWHQNITKNHNVNYDVIIDAQGLLKSAIMAKMFNGVLHGFNYQSIKEKLACLFYNKKYDFISNISTTQKNRLLASAIFNYSINNISNSNMKTEIVANYSNCLQLSNGNHDHVMNGDYTAVDFGFRGVIYKKLMHLNAHKYVIFFHATSKKSKCYNVANWAYIANYLINQEGLTLILPFGSFQEKEQSVAIKNFIMAQYGNQHNQSLNNKPCDQFSINGNNYNCCDYNNKIIIPDYVFNFNQLYQLISNASFVFGVDTGLIHVANSLSVPLIAIYVDSNPQKTGVIESAIAKNLGNIGDAPTAQDIIHVYCAIRAFIENANNSTLAININNSGESAALT